MSKEYWFECGDGFVHAWSTNRITYDARGTIRDFRSELAKRASRLDVRDDRSLVLDARYTAHRDQRNTDAENCLFYNVGVGSFANSALWGLRFQKVDWKSSCKYPEAEYLYSYKLIPRANLATFGDKSIPFRLQAGFKERSCLEDWKTVWFAVKEAALQPKFTADGEPVREFGVVASLRQPLGSSELELVRLVKPLFDGITCALHAQQPSSDPKVDEFVVQSLTKRIREKLRRDINADLIRRYLFDGSSAILGAIQMVRAYPSRLICFPHDHLCIGGILLLEQGTTHSWELQVEILRHTSSPG